MEKKPQKYVPNYIDFKCLFQSKISIDTTWTKYILHCILKWQIMQISVNNQHTKYEKIIANDNHFI